MRFQCTRCSGIKSTAEMGKSVAGKNGLHSWCLACLRTRARTTRTKEPKKIAVWNRWSKYRIGQEHYDAMLKASEGKCEICKAPMARICIDHDHETGVVRGLLCHACNIKLHALDSWPHLTAALRYLGRLA